MKFNFLYIIIIFYTFYLANAQSKSELIEINLIATWYGSKINFDSTYISKNGDSLKISELKFYLSKIKIDFDDATEFHDKNHYLIDFKNLNSLKIPICMSSQKIKSVNFSVGVDSLSSVSGALSGDLDPVNGMYWAWQSGYINLKIEGSSTSCKTRKNKFQFHIGGYQAPNNGIRMVRLLPKTNNLCVAIQCDELFNNLNLEKQNSIMMPGNPAMRFADLFSKIFYLK